MSQYPNRRRKRYTIRYDRIAISAAVLIVLLVMLVSCMKSCIGGEEKDSSSLITPTNTNTGTDGGTVNTTDSGAADGSTPMDTTGYTKLTQTATDMARGSLIVVNSSHAYTFPTDESHLVTIYNNQPAAFKLKDQITLIDSTTMTNLNNLMAAYYENTTNADLMIISAYRTKETQDTNFSSGSTDIKGGFTEYHTGMNFDIGIFPNGKSSYTYEASGTYAWFADNMANYGIILRYPEGKEAQTGSDASSYRFRYVGVPHAAYMKENNLCLEEYVELLKSYPFGTKTLKYETGGHQYEIYYIAANTTGDTEVFVPGSNSYTVSGNNMDGFIVTVTLS